MERNLPLEFHYIHQRIDDTQRMVRKNEENRKQREDHLITLVTCVVYGYVIGRVMGIAWARKNPEPELVESELVEG